MAPSVMAALKLPQPTYVIRTKHHTPPTYFGATFEGLGRSGVFAFATRSFATRVAQGLESHRRAAGRFPVLVGAERERLELGEDQELGSLDMLDVQEMDAHALHALVEGSGVVVCYMRMDGEEEDIHAHVVYDKQIQRTWIHDVYCKT